jgi:Rrf2 family protein
MHVSAKSDYAVRALVELAARRGEPLTADALAAAQDIPKKFLSSILLDLRRDGFVLSRRGAEGGYVLARSPAQITVAQVMRAVEGQLADVRSIRPEALSYEGVTESLQTVWVATRAALRSVLDRTTIADIAAGRLPKHVRALATPADAWR